MAIRPLSTGGKRAPIGSKILRQHCLIVVYFLLIELATGRVSLRSYTRVDACIIACVARKDRKKKDPNRGRS